MPLLAIMGTAGWLHYIQKSAFMLSVSHTSCSVTQLVVSPAFNDNNRLSAQP